EVVLRDRTSDHASTAPRRGQDVTARGLTEDLPSVPMDDKLKAFLANTNAKGSAVGAAVQSLDDLHLRRGVVDIKGEPRFELGRLTGRLIELTAQGASAVLPTAFGLVLEARERGEPVAWITLLTSAFYPPDVAEGGVDLDALVEATADANAGGVPSRIASAEFNSSWGPRPAPPSHPTT